LSKPERETHREALLNAAKTLLRQSGRANITARDLVAASGTNLGSIAYHFGSKEALLEEACKVAFEEWAETVARATSADPGTPPIRRLATSLEMILDEFDAMRPYFLGFIEIVVRSQGSPDIREQLVAHYRKQRATVAEMVTKSLGEAVGAQDAAHLASLLMAISDGLMLQSLIDPVHVPTSHQLTAASANALKALKQG
jgi:AcrR family transcriptional regulator